MGSKEEPVTGEEGFSVLEMVVALAILSVTMLASAPFFVNSLTSVNKQRTKQAAIQLAETAMEQVRGLKGSSLLTGRSLAATQAQFNAAPSVAQPYLATMEVAGGPVIGGAAPTLDADAPIPTAAQLVTVEGTTFTQNIYVGLCEVYLTGTTECIYPKGAGAPADTTQILKFFRVVVLETWSDSTCRDTSNKCSYIATTLVSRSSEPNFDFNRPAPQVMDNDQTWYVGDTVAYKLKARGGQLPNTWTLGALPPAGLGFDPTTGLISGVPTTPTAAGGLVTSATVTDHANRNNTKTVTFTVVRKPTPTLPTNPVAYVSTPYSLTLSATNGVAPYTYAATGLPAGLLLDATTGIISGSPTVNGTFTVTVTVSDANQKTGTGTYTLTVYPALVLAPLTDQTIDLGSKLALTAVGSGGDGTYSYTATGLPPGASINKNSGVINDKSTASGRFLPTITVTDGAGGTASQRIVVIVTTTTSLVFTAPAFTAADRTTAKGTATSLTLTTNGTLLGLSPALTVTGLPPGLSLNALTGVISGTPTTVGTYTVTVTASSLTPPTSSILTLVWKIT